MIEVEQRIKAQGRFELKVINSRTGEVRECKFDNLLLDGFFTQIQNRFGYAANLNPIFSNWSRVCRVGTGTSTPVATQTSLDAPLAANATTSTITNSAVYSYLGNQAVDLSQTFTFTLGAVVGNLTEIGICWASSGVGTHTRALIKDGLGNPTTLTVTSEDQLIVTYILTLSNLDASSSGVINLGGVDYSWTSGRTGLPSTADYLLAFPAVNPTSYDSTSVFGGFNVTPTSPSGNAGTKTDALGTVPGEVRTTMNASISQMNASGGIKCISLGCHKFQFTPVIPKDNTKTLSLTIKWVITR